MYELIQVSEQSYYIQSPAKIGLVKLNEQDICRRVLRSSPCRGISLIWRAFHRR
jgi:hypothetical protein